MMTAGHTSVTTSHRGVPFTPPSTHLRAALSLQRYLVRRHWNGEALMGPDPGVRFNYRVGRFIKNYVPARVWYDDLCYMQAQGYWVLANWDLYERTGQTRYRDLAVHCSQYIVARQREDGAWEYPNPEWKGRVATVEGIWASLGLLETFRHTEEQAFLKPVRRWCAYLRERIGFQQVGDQLAINYFAGMAGNRVPNNSTDALRFFAELASVTGDRRFLQPCRGLLAFLERAQKPSGEFPYTVDPGGRRDPRLHFQCYQYNAFQSLGLMRYRELTGDLTPVPIIRGILDFLRTGLAADGHVFYECGNTHRAVTYHAAAVGAAFARAGELKIDACDDLSDRAFGYVLRTQRADGQCTYSTGDYRWLGDRRSYPRYLAMILHHLLLSLRPHHARSDGHAGAPLSGPSGDNGAHGAAD
jgi:hypothetical protein